MWKYYLLAALGVFVVECFSHTQTLHEWEVVGRAGGYHGTARAINESVPSF